MTVTTALEAVYAVCNGFALLRDRVVVTAIAVADLDVYFAGSV